MKNNFKLAEWLVSLNGNNKSRVRIPVQANFFHTKFSNNIDNSINNELIPVNNQSKLISYAIFLIIFDWIIFNYYFVDFFNEFW